MGEVGKKNIMPVELAIQRELAYRKKVANLFRSDEFMKDLLPLQVPSSASSQSPNPKPRSWPEPSPVTRARPCLVSSSCHQFPSSSPNLIPSSAHQFPSSSSTPRLFPVPRQNPNPPHQLSSSKPIPRPLLVPSCNPSPGPRPCLTPRPIYSGIKRKATTIAQKRPQPRHGNYIVIDTVGNMFCELGQVSCTGPSCLKEHLKGHKHMAKLQLLQTSGKSGGEQEGKRPRCELCQIWCTNEDALKMHLQGRKHKAKEQDLERCQQNGEKAIQRPWCELCQISCMNGDCFEQHLKGQKHITLLYRERGGVDEELITCIS